MRRKNQRKYRLASFFTAAAVVMAGINGCGNQENAKENKSAASEEGLRSQTDGGQDSGSSTEAGIKPEPLAGSAVDTEFSDRDQDSTYSEAEAVKLALNGSEIQSDDGSVSISGSTATISGAGTYIISGTLENGQIIVDASDTDKIQVVLKDADIHCETSAALYVKKADKVFLTLAENSENRLSGGAEYVAIDDNTIDGVIFSKEDLTINGSGALRIDADYKHGIVSKDTLAVTGGSITVDSASQCLSGKDGIKILDGTFELITEGKALKSENTDDTTLGNIYVAGGKFTIKSTDDAFHAGGSLVIDGGSFLVNAGDDAFHAEQDVVVHNGDLNITDCYEGLEGYRVTIHGGSISLKASDDGINAAAPKTSEEQEEGAGIPGAAEAEMSGAGKPKGELPERGQMPGGQGGRDREKGLSDEMAGTVPEPPEGLEAMEAPKGEGNKEQRGQRPDGFKGGQMGPGGSMENDPNAYIQITGGTVIVEAGGDGLDSNGNLYISGGTVYVSGSEGGGDGALDYNGEGIITGGTVIAAGSSGMAQGFSEASTQYSILQNLSGVQEAKSAVTLTAEAGTVLASWEPVKKYSSVVISCSAMKQDGTYVLAAGTESAELVLKSPVTSNGKSAGGRGQRKASEAAE